MPAEIGASRSFDAELEADNAEDPHCPEEARSSPRWRGHGVCCAAGLVGLVLLASSASQGAVVASADDQAAVDKTRCRRPVGAPRHGQMQMRDRLPFAVRSRLHRLRRSMGLCCTTLPTRRYIACMAYIAYKAYIAYIAHQVGAPVAARLPAPAAPPHPGLTLAPALNPRRLLLPSAGLTLAPSLNPSQLLLTSAAGVPVQDRHDQCTGRRTRGQAGGLRD